MDKKQYICRAAVTVRAMNRGKNSEIHGRDSKRKR